MIGGVAAEAAVRTFPFRVFSFPSEIHLPTVDEILISQQQKFSPDIWDWDMLVQHNLFAPQTMFNLSRVTDHESRGT